MSSRSRKSSVFSDSAPTGTELLQCLTDGSSAFLFAYSPQLKCLTSWSKNAEDVLGVKDADIARDGNLFLRHVHPDDRFLLLTDLESAMQGSQPYRATYRWIRPDNNQVTWIHCRASLFYRDSGPSFEGLILDMSEEMTGHLGAFSGPDSVGAILGAFPEMVLILDKDLRLLRINRPSNKETFNFGDPQFKSEQLKIGRKFLDCFSDPAQVQTFNNAFSELFSGKNQIYRSRVALGSSVYSIEAVPVKQNQAIEGLLINVSDITELFELERKVADFRKSEGLRLLAAGVAHNFNNALQGIVGHAAIVTGHSERKDLVKQAGESIIEIVDRAANLAKQLFAFDDVHKNMLTETDINLCAMSAINRVDDLFSSGLKLAASFGNPGPIIANQSLVVDAIEAVIRNARESLSGTGTITIKTSEVQIADKEVEQLKAGAYVRLSVIDSGQGMDEETLARCLEPFFTTKNPDPSSGLGLHGSGLGLPRAFGLARELGGALTIESKIGQGCAVSFYIPVAVKVTTAQAEAKPVTIGLSAPKVLIVDDDAIVLKTAETILEDAGYGVLSARDSASAVALAERHLDSLELVLLDLIIPGSDAIAILRKLKRLKPTVSVIGFSGAPQTEVAKLLNAGASCILRKPVSPAALRQAVSDFLDGNKMVANS